MQKRWRLTGGVLALAAAVVLLLPETSHAQRWGGGGGYGGRGNTYYGGFNNGWGYPGYYNSGYGYNWGYPGSGYGAWNSGYTGNRSWGGTPWNSGYSSYYGPNYYYPSQGNYYGNSSQYPATGYYAPGFAASPPATQGYSYGAPSQANDNAARLEVKVPANAEVWFDGAKTNQGGTDRFFVSPPLNPGQTYSYDIRARWMDNGREVDRTQHVDVRPGENQVVDFSASGSRIQDRRDRPADATAPKANREEFRQDNRRTAPADRVAPADRTIPSTIPAPTNPAPGGRAAPPEGSGNPNQNPANPANPGASPTKTNPANPGDNPGKPQSNPDRPPGE